MLQAAAEQYRLQQGIAATTTAAVQRLWRRMGTEFDASWARIRPQMVGIVELGREAVVSNALRYTSAVLEETNQPNLPVGQLDPEVFLSSAPDGRGVDTLLDQSIVRAKTAVAGGATAVAALEQSRRWLTTVTLTLLADTRREVFAADIIQRPDVPGYVRMLNPPSCGRCIILAGKWFRWNTGFQRHPRCDCSHVPGREDVVGDERTDPYLTFRAMSPEEQEKVFGRIQARAIRDGADIYRVVNISGVTGSPGRGLASVASARRYGTPTRLTVDDIYRQAGTRTNAIRMMREEGYILPEGQTVRPRSPGVRTDAQVLAAGRGRGTVTIGGRTVRTARASRFDAVSTGQRDPLNRATMTAAERRLYDAHYRLQYARTTGNVPRGVGLSSADVYAAPIPATPARMVELERALAREVAKLRERGTPESVRRVARALGLL